MTSKLKLLVASSAVTLSLLGAMPAFAAGTVQGTSVLNNVSVDYQVGGVAQTQKTASDTFVVDRKIIFTVDEAATTGTTSVTPGQTAQVTRFQVTNTSNDTLDFSLAAVQQSTTTAAAHGGADAFDVTNFAYYVDANGNGIYEPGTDIATTIDNLPADQSVYVFIVGDIPLSATNGQIAGVTLSGTALNSNGTAITAATDATTNGAATVETIFADTVKSGVGGTSAARDGTDVANDDYTIAAAVLSVFKSSRIVSDGVSATNPKAIPGAVVEYCISVANAAGGATATNINISDIVPALTTYVASSILTNATVTSPGASQTCSAGAAGGTYTAGTTTVAGTLTDIAGGSASALIFRATVN